MTDPFSAGRADIRSVSFYISGADLLRARAAYEATNWTEGDRSWSHFVQKALLAEAARREAGFNDGRSFDGGEGPFKPGRPTVGIRLRAAEVSDAASMDASRAVPGRPASDDQEYEQGRNVQPDRGQS